MVPNYIRKIISGWSNYSCMVISHKMNENEMGYRGSKSAHKAVKEQRVDGSWFLARKARSLRCTLMGFERNYQVKIPSKNIHNNKKFSTLTSENISKPLPTTLDPWYITGLIDGEGSFQIRLRKSSKYKTGWSISPVFSLALHKCDLPLLKSVQAYFGGIGSISKSQGDVLKYSVESQKKISKFIIPHFTNFPLQTQKGADFLFFNKVIQIIKVRGHLNYEGVKNIVSIKGAINKGLSEELLIAFPNINIVARPLIQVKKTPNLKWIAGFVEAEGCFKITISNKPNNRYQVLIVFQITQHSRDKPLLNILLNYFSCGRLEKDNRKSVIHFSVYKFSDNYGKIIPFFKRNNLVGQKSLNFKDWCLIGEIIRSGAHLTSKGLENIKNIRSGMNKGRKF
uniref:hypothetical protein n=1 Tax=Perenniporia fraxinea TaxID=1350006 RepID=UPI0028E0A438|nr:hypothetical protein QLP32_mgp06 [Perenniporia fraxinea]WFS78672.1 hypothetical protein [Perenniporia fraxinea]